MRADIGATRASLRAQRGRSEATLSQCRAVAPPMPCCGSSARGLRYTCPTHTLSNKSTLKRVCSTQAETKQPLHALAGANCKMHASAACKQKLLGFKRPHSARNYLLGLAPFLACTYSAPAKQAQAASRADQCCHHRQRSSQQPLPTGRSRRHHLARNCNP